MKRDWWEWKPRFGLWLWCDAEMAASICEAGGIVMLASAGEMRRWYRWTS